MSAMLALLLAAQSTALPVSGAVELDLTGLRSERGSIRICLTRNPAHFPDCSGDPAAIVRTVGAGTRSIQFQDVPVGRYAVSVFHDENNNRKLDTFLGIPREGFGFSRNPTINFGPPHFDKVDIKIAPGFSRASVRMQYLL